MKKPLTLLISLILAAFFSSCTDYQTQIDNLKKQVEDLASVCDNSKSNITALETAVNAIKSGNPVESVEPVSEGGSLVGYTLGFKDGGKVTVYNQASNVTVDSDNGKYYWKADGEWIKDQKGNRIEVGGEEAPSPQFKIENHVLKMSLDGGNNWSEAAAMEKPLIAKVEDTPEGVTVTLTEGGAITIPRAGQYTVTFVADTVKVFDGSTVEASYTISGAPEGTTVYAIGSNGWKAEVISQDSNGGKVSVTAPEGATDTDVILSASDGKGKSYLAAIRCIARGIQPRFEIFAYASIPTPYATHENFVKMAEAGFTISHSNFTKDARDGATVLANVVKALDAAEGTGVKLCIPLTEWLNPGLNAVLKPEKNLEEVISTIKNHPALWGYLIGDEPSADELETYGSYIDTYQKLDPNHPWYTCFLPVSTYTNTDTHAEYVDAVTDHFLKHPTQFLPFDMYPVRTGNVVASWWYEALENYSRYTQQKNIPLAGMACSVEFDGQEFPSVEALRLQNYTNLAYGCQALMYFTYMVPHYKTDGWVDGSAPMKLDGTHSEVYDMVKQVNAELNNQAFVFLGSRLNWVRSAGSNPAPTKKLSTTEYTSVGFDYFKAPQHAVVSLLEKEGCRYLVIVNQSLQMENKLQMELSEDGQKAQIVNKDGSLSPLTDFVSEDKPVYTLGKGDALILKLD